MKCDTVLTVCQDEMIETLLTVIEESDISVPDLRQAVAECKHSRPAIGKLALQQRKLTTAQVFRVLEEQATSQELFGEIAVRLGYLGEEDLYDLLLLQSKLSPDLVDVLWSRGQLTRSQAMAIRSKSQRAMQTELNSKQQLA